ncbi:hypothetical protein CK203_070659 [Vitis vinifera]|uniref:Retrotransposon gag domain-containing protein n=1 Tax=Vitis vinifera TaxID=29760 RepID=A0A438C176_VITVI|nr:hypothetical protein CK203_070659 [Vitis vinifera]
MFLPKAKDVWDGIRETYSDAENASQIFELKTRLWKMKQGDRKVTKYYTEMLGLCKIPISTAKGMGVHRSRVLNRRPLPSIREVFSVVQQEESRRRVMLREHLTFGPEASVLITCGSHAGSDRPHVGPGPRQSKRAYCEHSHKGTFPAALSTMSHITPWIIDSGASDHMTDAHHLFTTYSPCADLSSGKTIGSVKECEGLYYFDEIDVHG